MSTFEELGQELHNIETVVEQYNPNDSAEHKRTMCVVAALLLVRDQLSVLTQKCANIEHEIRNKRMR